MAHIWEGVLPAVTTKFNADFSIDRAWTKRNIEAQIDAGVDGIIVCGSLGEASTLSLDEKLDVLDIAVDASRARVPVLLTIAENSTLDGCRQAEAGARRGASGYMVLPGLRYLSDGRETLNHFRMIANASALPLMIYNNPLAYGVDMTPDMFAEIADEKKIVAIKESCGDGASRNGPDQRGRRSIRHSVRRRQSRDGSDPDGRARLGGGPCVRVPA